ncbi:hypothetical protein AJ78_03939 [Emergomyces pasteurianus Ep9510]|uniref:Uncharacterized protein n=1 Tax=Emergomyces pasteurianus Ep9510 TaxID=1447872 RepID=A0A1J9PIV8_9EURO|nr:hypothetical protein AJ78_03939 [Emergomyces pasteurianus Ep9510]
MIAQLVLKFCFVLFLTKSVAASPAFHASDFAATVQAAPANIINIPPRQPPVRSAVLATRNDIELLAEGTDSAATQQLDDATNQLTKRGKYSKGTCWIHLWESLACGPGDRHELYARLNLKDNRGKKIAHPKNGANGGKGRRIDQKFYEVRSELPYVLLIQGHDKDDYVQFEYGGHSWTTNTKGKSGQKHPYCNTGAYDPKPYHGRCHFSPETRVRQMDCYFPC